MTELRARFRLGLTGYPRERQTIQDGVDLAELDIEAYMAETNSEQRIYIGELSHANGIQPTFARTTRYGRKVVDRRITELAQNQPDTAFSDAVQAEYDQGEPS